MRLLLTIAMVLTMSMAWATSALPELDEGDQLREAYLRGLTSHPALLSDFKGKPLIINFWASYCGPCLGEMGSLEALHQTYGDDITFIGITIDDYPERAYAFLEKADTSFHHYIDHRLELETMFGSQRIPLTVLISPDGEILHKVYGAREWDSPEWVGMIREAFQLN